MLLMGLHLLEVVVDSGRLHRCRDVIAQHAQLSEGIACRCPAPAHALLSSPRCRPAAGQGCLSAERAVHHMTPKCTDLSRTKNSALAPVTGELSPWPVSRL